MHIARVQLEEGFLDGLNLALRPGLVTLIGARGTGKTSVIELIRFCLGVGGYTPESSKRSREHALSVLGSGQITVILADGAREVTVSRTAAEDKPRSSGPFHAPIIFSQTEIETVGMQPGGRLRLLDSFLDDRASIEREEAAATAEIRSLTLEVASLRREIDDLERQQAQIPLVIEQLTALAPKEAELAAISAEAALKTGDLTTLSAQTSTKLVAATALANFTTGADRVRSAVQQALQLGSNLDRWPEGTPNLLEPLRVRLAATMVSLGAIATELAAIGSESTTVALTVAQERLELEERARTLRREVDELQAGAGATMRQGQQLRERKAQLEALAQSVSARKTRLQALEDGRNQALDRLDAVRESRFRKRLLTVQGLNKALGPRIRLQLNRCGQFERFAAALAEGLRGSGLRYTELSDALAERVSPRELLEAVETNDIDLISDAAGISADRALKVLTGLKEGDLGTLGSILIEDNVSFELLDGVDYKDISELSTGQRCTVILPIILQHRGRLLIVDQPEDHIDNAFIADTLIKSILARDASGQILFSTHNANIPVLGNADLVVELDSDGKRGFVRVNAPLEDDASVHAITTVMEGGRAAFNVRAKFYQRHGSA